VAWVAERKDVLSTFLGLLTVLLYAFSVPIVGLIMAFIGLVASLSAYWSMRPSVRKTFWVSLISSAGILNRQDTALLLLPVVLLAVLEVRTWRALLAAFSGMVPLALWELFSLLYFGFPFPNTAYAKLNTGIPLGAMVQQGMRYVADSFSSDRVTLPMVLAGAALPLLRRSRDSAIAVGVVLYALYTLRIGGDFMSGRFFAAPLVVAVALLVRHGGFLISSPRRLGIAACAIVLLGATSAERPLLCGRTYGSDYSLDKARHGIANERAHYYPVAGLLPSLGRRGPWPVHPWADQGRMMRASGESFKATTNIGYVGYCAGPKAYILDLNALSDPLLARLPIADTSDWRIGHFERAIPQGYLETLMSGANAIVDPQLAALYDSLVLVVKGRLFSPDRLHAVWSLNFGRLRGLTDACARRESYYTVRCSGRTGYFPRSAPSSAPTVRSILFEAAGRHDSALAVHRDMVRHGLKSTSEDIHYWLRIHQGLLIHGFGTTPQGAPQRPDPWLALHASLLQSSIPSLVASYADLLGHCSDSAQEVLLASTAQTFGHERLLLAATQAVLKDADGRPVEPSMVQRAIRINHAAGNTGYAGQLAQLLGSL